MKKNVPAENKSLIVIAIILFEVVEQILFRSNYVE